MSEPTVVLSRLATPEDVARRLEEEPTERMLLMIEEYLEDISDQIRDYGLLSWNAQTVPPPVSRIAAAAVARFMRNPDALQTSRAADETLSWQDSENRPLLEPEEIARIRRHAHMENPGALVDGFGTGGLYLYSEKNDPVETVWVPWGNHINKPFPIAQINDPQGAYRAWW